LSVEFREVDGSVFLAYGAVVTFGGVVLPIRDMNLNECQSELRCAGILDR